MTRRSNPFGKLSQASYRVARTSRNANALQRAISTGSPKPLLRRAWNRALGRMLGRLFRR
jgi:hypothetical protein